MRLSGKSYLLLGIGLVTGVAAALQSFAIVNQRRAPARSLALGMPFDGAARASLASLLQAVRIAKNPNSKPSRREVELASQAFASEPLAKGSLPILVQSEVRQGKTGQAELLLGSAGRLTRRDNLVNAMLIDDAMKRNEPKRAILLLGRAMAVSYKVRDLYVGRMAAATVNPGALSALPPLLGRRPEWGREYWTTVAGNSALVLNGARVRQKIAGSPWNLNTPEESDFLLIRELANLDPGAALKLSQALGLKRGSTSEILANSDFRHEPRFVPLDWELLQSGDIGADIEPEAGRLVLSSLPGSSGIAARQLVQIGAPGRYRLRWKVSGLPANTDASLKFRLACAERSKTAASIAPASLGRATGNATLDVRVTSCGWYWATLEFDTSTSTEGVDVEVHQLSLRRVGAAPTAADSLRS
ncbi:hypothetical protein [Sphingopyxis sp. NFH-91]|uniref:hypothetical protein n=1 Tax=unclassified Sphingopyxis TaxID=2614943 RepID=UPI001F32CC1B|nr:hypothetical protein [Sphingopyxis sp. NFH-91]